MERTEVMEKLLNCQYLWLLVKNRVESLLYNTETPERTIWYSKTEILLPNEAMTLIQEFEDAAAQERLAQGKKEAAVNKLKAMLGTAEVGRIDNRIVSWRNVEIEQFNEKELLENEPELHRDYTKLIICRKFEIK